MLRGIEHQMTKTTLRKTNIYALKISEHSVCVFPNQRHLMANHSSCLTQADMELNENLKVEYYLSHRSIFVILNYNAPQLMFLHK